MSAMCRVRCTETCCKLKEHVHETGRDEHKGAVVHAIDVVLPIVGVLPIAGSTMSLIQIQIQIRP